MQRFLDLIGDVLKFLLALVITSPVWYGVWRFYRHVATEIHDPDNIEAMLGLLPLYGISFLLILGAALFVTVFVADFIGGTLPQPFSAWVADYRRKRQQAIRAAKQAAAEAKARAEQQAAHARYLEQRAEEDRLAAERREWQDLIERNLYPLPAGDTAMQVFSAYAQATSAQRALIILGYQTLLARMHPRDEEHRPQQLSRFSGAARLLFLGAAIGAENGKLGYDALDLAESDHTAGRYVFRADGGVPDMKRWEASVPAICAYLGGSWSVARGAGTTVVLTAKPNLGDAFALPPDALKAGHVYLGQDLASGRPVHVALQHLSHTLVAGPTGMGKSVFLHQLMASVVANLDLFERIYLVDLKYGLELQDYPKLGPKFRLTAHANEMPALVAELLAEMDRRGHLMRANGQRDWTGPLILVVIDEFADVLLGVSDKTTRTALENSLTRLTNLSRALGFRFWVQSQKTTNDAIPTPIRNNLQSVVSFRMVTNQAAAMLFGGIEQLPADITLLKRGQAIYRDGRTSDTVALQGALVEIEDVAKIAETAKQRARNL